MVRAEMSDMRHRSYWLDQLEPVTIAPTDPPARADVVVVGSGYTGLSAAIQTARGGRNTLVLDAGDLGHGCSTRNGGQISTSVKPSMEALTAKYGADAARAMRGEGVAALDWLADFVAAEGLACDFKRSGRFHAAHTPGHYEAMVRNVDVLAREGIESFAVPRAEQRRELGTDVYFGGVVFPRHASVHPAKMHREFLRLAHEAGAETIGHCAVTGIERTATGFTVTTEKGTIEAGDVIVATNGYTTGLTPWLQRRVIPIGSYIIATEELPKSTIDTLFPGDRMATDSCKVVYYYRASPDRRRVIFGGRVSSAETDTNASAPRLYDKMCATFPELRGCQITHSWSGTVAYTFDEMPHIGVADGVHYAQGYCGAGVSMSSYLGMRLGQKLLGLAEGRTAFDDIPNPTRPFYTGKPWFLPAAVSYYRWIDERQSRRALVAS